VEKIEECSHTTARRSDGQATGSYYWVKYFIDGDHRLIDYYRNEDDEAPPRARREDR
jgi:hypothetical protein